MSNTFGNVDLSTVSTTVDKVMLTDSQFDALWEVNKDRMFTHKAFSVFNDQGTKDENNPYYATDIDNGKIKCKQYLSDWIEGTLSTMADTFFCKVWDGETLIGLQLMHGSKWKDGVNIDNNPTGQYIIESVPDIATLWAQEVGSGDYRDNMLCMDVVYYTPMVDGTPSSVWSMSHQMSSQHLIAMHTEAKNLGYTHVIHVATGQKQKAYFKLIFDTMKTWEEGSGFPNGPHQGVKIEGTPVWNYVDDNTTPAYQFSVAQYGPAYTNDFPAEIKPCGWPITTNKVGGEYPPYS